MPEDDSQQQTPVVKPNARKACISRLLYVLGFVIVLAGAVVFLSQFIGLEDLLMPLESLGIEVDTSTLLPKMIIDSVAVIFVVSLVAVILGYTSVLGMQFELGTAGMTAKGGGTLEIPYQNVVKVSCDKDGIFNTLFRTGTLIVELTGLDREKAKLTFVDNPERWTQYIQGLVQKVKATHQAQFTERQKINKILTQT